MGLCRSLPVGLGVWGLAMAAGAASAAEGGTPGGLAEAFANQPVDTLVRRLEPGSGSGEAPGPLTAGQEVRCVEAHGAAVIQTTVRNTTAAPQPAGDVTLADWTFRLGGCHDAGYAKLEHSSAVWYESTFWQGNETWLRVGRDWHHPGDRAPSVRRFTAPADGTVTVSGSVYKAHRDGDGVKVSIRHNEKTVWEHSLAGDDGKGVDPNLKLEVRAGDAVRFVVEKGGQIFCDTTHWDPVITYAGGRQFQASKGFSERRQGENGWSYEMPSQGPDAPGVPRLVWFDNDWGLLSRSLTVADAAAAPVVLSGNRSQPCAVIADGEDQSGVLIATEAGGPWRLECAASHDGRLRVKLVAGARPGAAPLAAGGSERLPDVVLGSYRGSSAAGIQALTRWLADPGDELPTAALRARLQEAGIPEPDLWAMIQQDWQQQDAIDPAKPETYAAAVATHVAKTRALLEDLRAAHGPAFLAAEGEEVERLAAAAGSGGAPGADPKALYMKLRQLKRRIALSNPLMDFGPMLFCKRVPTSYSHLVMQYYGWRARPGGGLFVLERPGRSLECRAILDGQLAGGNVLEPRLSYDGKRIVFSYVACEGKRFDPGVIGNDDPDEGFYHVYEVKVDGTGLRQLTRGPYDDLMPTYLPDGGIAFCSTRRKGYARCFGGQFSRRWDVYTLHRMEADGSKLRTLSFHDTNEWFPAVSNTGHLLYARWDYIDRDAVTHQTLWSSRPDGTNPFALWGNATAKPHCTFQIQPIPGSSKIIFTAAAHHSIAAGPIAMVDAAVDANGQGPITRITPEIPFPEAESRDIREYYAAPWPLSEDYYLVAYSPKPLVWEPGANPADALGIYLLDRFGNRELLYRDPEIGSTNPCPLRARSAPPVLPSALPEGSPPAGEMFLADVYQGLGGIARGTVKRLRIVQIFPKTTNLANVPPIGMAREENGRAILGTVPVEADGSARFLVPAGKPVLFQALDADGMAVQTMRTITYVHPGERISCVGCHENRRTAPDRPRADALAMRRGPSAIDPGELGGRPFSYVEVVQPIWDAHCVACHRPEKLEGGIDLTGRPEGAFSKSYVALMGDVDFWAGGTNPENAAKALVPRFGGRNQVQVTPPGGLYGALGSRLVKLLREGHEDVRLTPGELARVAAWIDLNAIFYGVYLPEAQAAQLRGERVPMPEVQ